MKSVDKPAPFVPSNETLLWSVCIEDMGSTGRTLLNELPLKGSLSKDDLSFSQLPKEVSFRIPECDSSMLANVSQLPSSSRDNSILYGKRPVPAQYPGRLSWTREEGYLSITKLVDEVVLPRPLSSRCVLRIRVSLSRPFSTSPCSKDLPPWTISPLVNSAKRQQSLRPLVSPWSSNTVDDSPSPPPRLQRLNFVSDASRFK